MSRKPQKKIPKRKPPRIVLKPASRMTVLILMILMAVLTIQILRMNVQIQAAYAEEAVVAQRLEELRETNRQLQDDLDNSTDPALIESIARDQLGMVREGEKVFHISK